MREDGERKMKEISIQRQGKQEARERREGGRMRRKEMKCKCLTSSSSVVDSCPHKNRLPHKVRGQVPDTNPHTT